MLYKRSSFIKFLTDIKLCEVTPLKGRNVLQIKNHNATVNMWIDPNDRIDYEEIWLVCNKLYIDGLPSDKELERIE